MCTLTRAECNGLHSMQMLNDSSGERILTSRQSRWSSGDNSSMQLGSTTSSAVLLHEPLSVSLRVNGRSKLKITKPLTKPEEEVRTSSDDPKMVARPPSRTSSSLLRKKPVPLTRNGKSMTFPPERRSNELKVTKSCAKLEDMRNFISRSRTSPPRRTISAQGLQGLLSSSRPSTRNSSPGGIVSTQDLQMDLSSRNSPPRRTLSSQALQAFSKRLSTKQPSLESEPDQDPVFFSMIQYNPMDAEERAKYDDLAVKKYIRRNPEALRAKYDFQVGGRGKLTVSRYPLSALVALGASFSTVRLAIKANPSALEATKDFHTTALHTACSSDTDMQVVRYIYNKYPPAIRESNKLVYLPLHNACQASSDKTPMLEIIQFLVEEYPEGLMAINKLGDTPLRIAQRNKSMPGEVLDFLEEETQRVFSLEENSETLYRVRERQSWGSRELKQELSTELIQQVIMQEEEEEEDGDEEEQPVPAVIGVANDQWSCRGSEHDY